MAGGAPRSRTPSASAAGSAVSTAIVGAVSPEGALVLVKGDDPVLRDRLVREVASAALGDDDPTLALADFADDADVGAIVDAASTPPFLTARRVVVAREIGRFGADAVDALKNYLVAPAPTTVLVLVSGGGTTSRAISDAVKRRGAVLDAAIPGGKARQQWLAERLATGSVRLDARAVARLADHLGEDLARVDGIVAVLGAVYGEGARIGVDELEPFLGAGGASAPWDLTDAIDRGDVAGALAHLHRAMSSGEKHPLQLLASLGAHVTRMLRLDGAGCRDEAEAAAVLGMTGSTFPARKALAQSRALGGVNLARAVALLHQADLDLRGARDLPDQALMEVLVARLARLAPTGR